VKSFRATLFLKASASYSKILNIKSTFNTCSENFQGNSFSQGKRKLLKNSECKKYIQYMQWKFSGQLSFSGQSQVSQKLLMVKKFNTVKILGQTLSFRASASCSKILHGEKIFNTAHIHVGVIRVISASLLCNLDQCREWL